MALRVLLADESTTIKKVIQLALQDFGVEVKAVHVGVDVLEVARTFQPELIFADILLQKKNGYEVCLEIKKDPTLKSIPVVLMWSSFMELDENLAAKSGADRRLEKPFEVHALRNLVLELVPRLKSQPLARFLQFSPSITEPIRREELIKREALPTQEATPEVPKEDVLKPKPPPSAKTLREEREAKRALGGTIQLGAPTSESERKAAESRATSPAEGGPDSKWSMDSFDDIANYTPPEESASSESQHPENQHHGDEPVAKAEDRDPWAQQDLAKYKLDLPQVDIETDELGVQIDLDDADRFKIHDVHQPVGASPYPTSSSAESRRSILDDTPVSLEIAPEDLEITRSITLDINLPPMPPAEPPTFIEPLVERQRRAQRIEEGFELTGSIPQLSADRLEEIVRAQSRDIIESMVRRIVPDIAAEMIRDELERLLEDTQVRDRR